MRADRQIRRRCCRNTSPRSYRGMNAELQDTSNINTQLTRKVYIDCYAGRVYSAQRKASVWCLSVCLFRRKIGVLQSNKKVMWSLHCESKKTHQFLFRNFAKCLSIFEIFSLLDSAVNLQKSYLKIPPSLNHVATLPFEISMFKKSPRSRSK